MSNSERASARWVGWMLLIALLLAVAAIAGITDAIVAYLIGWAAKSS